LIRNPKLTVNFELPNSAAKNADAGRRGDFDQKTSDMQFFYDQNNGQLHFSHDLTDATQKSGTIWSFRNAYLNLSGPLKITTHGIRFSTQMKVNGASECSFDLKLADRQLRGLGKCLNGFSQGFGSFPASIDLD
jgi:hypothetical protein